MTARSIWQGKLTFQKHEFGVKLFSAVLDRQIHFHLLHRRDRTRVQQRMVDSESGKAIPFDESRKAFEAEPGVFVPLTREEIDRSVPDPSREIRIRHFVPTQAIDAQLFDRPYYLGPADNFENDYFALAQALNTKKSAGFASWVMRKHSYVGALIAQRGYLMLVTLRHADEVIPTSELEPPQGRALVPKERDMAEKLIDALSGRFEPKTYRDEYQERIHELIAAKRKGKKAKAKHVPLRRRYDSLADSLRASLKGISGSRSA